MAEPVQLFHFVINGFHVFGNKFFAKKTSITFFCIFFVYLLLIFIDERPHNTSLVYDEGAIEHILGTKVWRYGFQRIFWEVVIDF